MMALASGFHAATAYARLETAPEVYTVIPPQPVDKKPGQLEQWQLEHFFDKGFVQVNKFFTKEELQPVLEVKLLAMPFSTRF